MTEIILNERSWVESVLKNLTLGRKPSETIGRVARYYRAEGYKRDEVHEKVEDFLVKCDPNISLSQWQGLIESSVRSADKYRLIDIDGVCITKAELDMIAKLNGKLLQKLMFTLLCLAKYGNAINKENNGWVNQDQKNIFSLANIAVTTMKQSLMINDLWSAEYIGYSCVVDNVNINVKIIDSDSEVVMHVTDFRNLGNQYMRYIGENYMECKCCGAVIKRTSNIQKYCKDCAADMNRKKTLENYHISVMARA